MIRRQPKTRLRLADAIGEALTTIAARPARAAATMAGILLGVAWWVAVLGLASTAAGQLTVLFASRLAAQVTVSWTGTGHPIPVYPFPADAERRVDALPGVVAAGVYWRLSPPVLVSARHAAGVLPVIAASPGFLPAASLRVTAGRPFNAWDQAHAAPVCLVSGAAAAALHVGGPGQAIDVGSLMCAVIGVFSAATPAVTADSVLLPSATAIAVFGRPNEQAGAVPSLLARVRPGAAARVAREVTTVLSPAGPRRYRVYVPPSPLRLGAAVTAADRRLFAFLSRTSLVVGVLVIALSSGIFALGRTAEFGLRRACGARRRHLAAQVLAETALLGLLGGLAGAGLGVAVVALVARAATWLPVIEPLTVLPAPLAAAAVAMLAGLAGSLRGAWSAPAAAMDAGAMMPW